MGHSSLGGPLSKGNALTDEATCVTFPALINPIDQAKQAQTLHHLTASTLCHMVRSPGIKQRKESSPEEGVPPCCQFPTWESTPGDWSPTNDSKWMSPTFPPLETIDTYSGFIHASPLSGEASCDVITHTLQCMATMGKPQVIQTDNGPGYTGVNSNSFVPSLTLNTSQAFHIILRARA